MRQSHGYALLLTLVMLALTATAVSTLAKTSATRALAAKQAERDLQIQFAESSCRRVLMPAMQQYLGSDANTSQTRGGASSRTATLSSLIVAMEFGDLHVVARLDDQNALPNLNALLASQTPPQAAGSHPIFAAIGLPNPRHTWPLQGAIGQRVGIGTYSAWQQLYPQTPPATLCGLDPHAATTTYPAPSPPPFPLTLWGNEKLNLWTASEQALHGVLDGVMDPSDIAELVTLRDDTPYREQSIAQMLQTLGLSISAQSSAQRRLTDESQTYALWLAVTPTSSERHPAPSSAAYTSWSLTISGWNDGSGSRPIVFHW